MIGSTILEKKLLKNYSSRFSVLSTKLQRKNFPIKKFVSPFDLITTLSLSLFHDQIL